MRRSNGRTITQRACFGWLKLRFSTGLTDSTQSNHRCINYTNTQRWCFGGTKTSFSTDLIDAPSDQASVQSQKSVHYVRVPTAIIWTQRDRLNRCLHRLHRWSRLLCSGCATAMAASPLYISRPPGLFVLPLIDWTPEATQEKKRECFESWDEDLELEIVPNLKKSTLSSVASVLELWANWVSVKWRLRSLLLLVLDGTKTVLVIGRFLVSSWSLWEPQEEKIVHGVKLAVPEMEKEHS